MANFRINFQTTIGVSEDRAPMYKVTVTTALVDPEQASSYDGFLLLIQRKETVDGLVDVFYGVAKPADLKEIPKRRPNKNGKFYRVDNWNLVFYNEKTMDESIALLRSQVDSLAYGVAVAENQRNQRSVTHVSPSF